MADGKLDSEEAIIAELWAPLAAGFPGAFGLADDCAAISPGEGCDLIVTTDAVISGVHFLAGTDARAIAWKALAVNVSDLVAKGATPLAYLMTIALPGAPERSWLAAFAEGLRTAQERFGCRLAGGDTDRTPGPLSVSITALGSIPAGRMVHRSGARPGDVVLISGSIGDAALGLALLRDRELARRWQLDAEQGAYLEARQQRPEPHVSLAPVVREGATAAMDVSDGLVKDFARLCAAAGVGGRIDAARVPLSTPAQTVLAHGGTTLAELITGGEDYEVLMTVAADRVAGVCAKAAAVGVTLTAIGAIEEAGMGARVLGEDGRVMELAQTGWDHFAVGGQARSDATSGS